METPSAAGSPRWCCSGTGAAAAPPPTPCAAGTRHLPEAPATSANGGGVRKGRLAKQLQSELDWALRQNVVDWQEVRDLMAYEDCLNPNYVDHSTQLATSHRAAYDGQTDILKWCLLSRAEVNARTATGRSPLHYACNGNRLGCIRLLLEERAAVNARSLSGQTPLHICCVYDKYEAALELLHGAPEVLDIDVEDSQRKIPEALTKSVQIKRAIRKYRAGMDDLRQAALVEQVLLKWGRKRAPARPLEPLPEASTLCAKLQPYAADGATSSAPAEAPPPGPPLPAPAAPQQPPGMTRPPPAHREATAGYAPGRSCSAASDALAAAAAAAAAVAEAAARSLERSARELRRERERQHHEEPDRPPAAVPALPKMAAPTATQAGALAPTLLSARWQPGEGRKEDTGPALGSPRGKGQAAPQQAHHQRRRPAPLTPYGHAS